MSSQSRGQQQSASWGSSTPARAPPPSHTNSGTVVVRGFDPRSRGLLTPVIELPTPGPDSINSGNAPENDYFGGQTLRRRSSFGERIGHLADVGGVNSLNNFARSWQRAAGFYEITPLQRSFAADSDEEGGDDEGDDQQPNDEEATPRANASLLRTALQNKRSRRPSVATTNAGADEGPSDSVAGRLRERRGTIREREGSIFQIEPQLASIFGGNYGATYGSLSARVNESSIQHAGRLFLQQQSAGVSEPDKEREPLLVKTVEQEDGKLVNVVVGQSTIYQTIFNSVNILIGMGMLALPIALRYSGWVIGLIFFAACAATTNYTAKLLAKCLNVDGSLITFSDLAYVSFGPRARFAVSILFTLELVATCMAFVILFADSLNSLIEGWDVTGFKILCGFLVTPLGFLPLRFLSFTSIIGILSSMIILLSIYVDGFVKKESPGSLLHPMPTQILPNDFKTIPLAIGLMMSPFGAHSVFPSVYRDMRHPHKWAKACNYTYTVAVINVLAICVAGYLMFGEDVLVEVTASIFMTEGFPQWISVIILIAVAIIPITKIPLNARPIISTFEIALGLDARAMPVTSDMAGMSGLTRGILKLTVRILIPVVFVLLAIVLPEFDRVMSLLGAAACSSISFVLPLAFHLRIFGKELSVKQRFLDWTLIVFWTIIAIIGTVAACLPKSVFGIIDDPTPS